MTRIGIGALAAVLLSAAGAFADCERDTDCGGGSACVQHRCVQRKSCMRDSDCSGDQICEQRVCISPGGFTPAPAPAPAPSGGGWGQPKQPPTPPPPAPAPAPAPAPPPEPPRQPASSGGGWGAPPRKSDETVRGQVPQPGAGMKPVYDIKTWPLWIGDRPLVLAPGMSEVGIALFKDFSADGYGSQGTAAALSADFGATREVTVGVSTVALCVTNCGDRLLAAAVHGKYLYLGDADRNIALTAGLFIQSFSSFTLAVPVGLELATRLSPELQLYFSPALRLGLIGRGNSFSPDAFSVVVQPRFRLTPELALLASLGLNINLELRGAQGTSDSYDGWTMPLGLGALYAMRLPGLGMLDVGGTLTLGNIFPHDLGPGYPAGITNIRGLVFYGIFRL